MPIKLIKNRLFEVNLAVTLLYWVIAPLVHRYLVFEVGNAMTFSVALGIVVAYSPGAFRSMRLPWREVYAAHFITVGIWQFWLVEACQRVWSMVNRAMGQPPGFNDNLSLGYLIVMGALAGVYHVITKEQSDVFPHSDWRVMGVMATIATLILFTGWKLLGVGGT